ncbi:MAG TPA: hypothetical protein VFG53_09790 [Anaeromyxobacter sp.]|nr:hypothetical protein [Anaeromyxobacter sp.]
MAWAGWGAGPAGAGAAGGPSRGFLGAALTGCAIVAGILVARRNWPGASVAALAACYFVARLFLGLGQRRRGDRHER